MRRILLPPPAETILMYAAWGWADEQGYRAASGRPRLPERHLWVPLFHYLAQEPAGLAVLKRLAMAGCRAWSVPPSISGSLEDAFADPRLGKLFEAAIADLAETARTRFNLPNEERETPVAGPMPYRPAPPPNPVSAPRPIPGRKPRGMALK